jgi:protein-disulfide isomerase
VAACVGSGVLLAFRAAIELGVVLEGAIAIRGLPAEYVLLLFFAGWGAIDAAARLADTGLALRLATYRFAMATVGLSLVLWLLQLLWSAGLVPTASIAYWISWSCVVAMFVFAAFEDRSPVRGVLGRLVPDAAQFVRRPAAWAFGLGAIGLLLFGPRGQAQPTDGWRFDRWFAAQPRSPMPVDWQSRPVTLVEFIDYQCRVCRQADERYREPLEELQRRHPEVFAVVRVEFPLENECNPSGPVRTGGRHLAACEAAVAVRLARQRGPTTERQVVDWLWRYQSTLSPEFVFASVPAEFGLDLRSGYDESLETIQQEASMARALGVTGTPTYFLNGRRLSVLPAATMVRAIEAEIGRVTGGR